MMMNGIDDLFKLRNKLIGLKDEMPNLLRKSFDEIHTIIEDKIIDQLSQGLKGDGTYQRDYSPISVKKYGKPPGPILLHDRGGFYRGVVAEAQTDGVMISSNDVKTDMLLMEYGDETLNLTQGNKEVIAKEVLPVNLKENIIQYFES